MEKEYDVSREAKERYEEIKRLVSEYNEFKKIVDKEGPWHGNAEKLREIAEKLFFAKEIFDIGRENKVRIGSILSETKRLYIPGEIYYEDGQMQRKYKVVTLEKGTKAIVSGANDTWEKWDGPYYIHLVVDPQNPNDYPKDEKAEGLARNSHGSLSNVENLELIEK